MRISPLLALAAVGALAVPTAAATLPAAASAARPVLVPVTPARIASPAAPSTTPAAADRPDVPEHPGRGDHGKPGSGTTDPEPPADPPFSVPEDQLAAAIDCSDLTDEVGADREPILLVHGTFTHGHEEYDWSWIPVLDERGYDWCMVTYPDRGLGDLQVSAEYVAYAVDYLAAATGRKVDMVGHSQGGLMPRWAIKWWPSVQANLDDFVMLAAPNHGTNLAGFGFDMSMNPAPVPEMAWQFAPGSAFITALNADDETPGDIDYTSLYTTSDELVQPSYGPDATAILEPGSDNPHLTNLNVEEHCPGRVVDHLTIGTTDRAGFTLTLLAFAQDGPLDLTAPETAQACRTAPDEAAQLYAGAQTFEDASGLPATTALDLVSGAVPEPIMRFGAFGPGLTLLQREVTDGEMPDWHLSDHEPPLRDYAQG